MEGQALEFGGAIAVALALVEVIKLLIYKFVANSNEKAAGFPSPDGYVKEAIWRDRYGAIIKEQHDLTQNLETLMKNQNGILQSMLDLLHTHTMLVLRMQ